MNIHALIPLLATIAYIPLLLTTAGARPWSRQQRLFIFFLLSATLWSLSDYLFRANFFPQYNLTLIRVVILITLWMTIQFHTFTSSFFPASKSRWILPAYGSLVICAVVMFLGYLPRGITTAGNYFYADYGPGLLFLVIPMLALLARNVFIFIPRLRNQEHPVLHNQTQSILLCIGVLTVFLSAALTPFGKEFPVSHAGNLINAIILSYAVVGKQLFDIRFVLRRGVIWLSIVVIGIAGYLSVLLISNTIFDLNITTGIVIAATASGLFALFLVYSLRDMVSRLLGKIFQGQTFYYREKLLDFANTIHNVFSLKEQGGELLTLVTKAVGCKQSILLFLDPNGNYEAQPEESPNQENPLCKLKLRGDNPIVEFLKREHRPLARESLAIMPEFLGLWQQEKDAIDVNRIDLFMPLISRDRLIGILILDKKETGHYNLEDFSLLENVTKRVAVSMEKEYLREQLKEREEELSVINRSNAIITSSLDIQRIYDNFIKELKQVVAVDWAAIAVIEGSEVYFMALSSDINSPWKAGERLPLKGSGTEWVANHGKAIVDYDLTVETHFVTGKTHLLHGIRTVAYLPLIISNNVIGALIVASRKPAAYTSRHLKILEQLASQIAMPIENARLFANTERLARIDGLTGLLNRRSLDETLSSEIGRHSRYGGVFSVIIFDIDGLKKVNDNFGHLTGDELLRKIGSIIKNSVRESDQAFRYGGDEFAILLPQTHIETALKVAERIRHQTFAQIEIGSMPISISLGLSSWPADGVVSNDVLAAADSALYVAKRNGKNQSVCSSAELKPYQKNQMEISLTDNHDSGTLSAIFALAATVDARDQMTLNHSKQVHSFSIAIGEALGLDQLEIHRLGTCALLHDIGKIGINDAILNKQERLSDAEWEAIKSHSRLGAAIVGHYRQLSPCIQGILYHHEKYNGEGYPEGLKGEEIPLESRILAIADSFSAMTSVRIYSHALTYDEAIEEIRNGSGKQFDPKLVEVFLKIVPGSIAHLEQIKSGRE